MCGPHIFLSSRDTHDTGHTTQLEPYTHWPANRSAGQSTRSSNSLLHSIHRLHYHLGMLLFRERIRSTKEGTMQTAGWITEIESKAGQIAGGELRQTKGYLGKIPCIKESLYLRKRRIYLYSFRYAHFLRLFSRPPLPGENTLYHPGTFVPKPY